MSHGSLRNLISILYRTEWTLKELKKEEFIIEGLATKLLFARVLVFVLTPTSDQVSVCQCSAPCNWDLITPSHSEARPGAPAANYRHGREKWASLSPDKSRPNVRSIKNLSQ